MPDLAGREEWEKKLARELGRLFNRTQGEILEMLGDPPDINNIPSEFWDEIGEVQRVAIGKFFREVYMQAIHEILDDGPIGVDWDLVNEAAAEWAERSAFDLVSKLDDTSRTKLQEAVAKFYREQKDIEWLRNELIKPFGPVRAELIASTETTRAAVEGELQGIRELEKEGIEMISIWFTSMDEWVCEICEPLDKKEADGYLSDRTPYWIHPDPPHIQYGQVGNPAPPAHPRCRCWQNHEAVLTKQVMGA
jgi:hypothetical protein